MDNGLSQAKNFLGDHKKSGSFLKKELLPFFSCVMIKKTGNVAAEKMNGKGEQAHD
jgi:hypothetical protein